MEQSESPDSPRFKKFYWLLAGLAAAFAIFILLLLYKPARFSPPDITYDNQVSPYLTHRLLPQLYNGAQLGEPFDLVVTQEGINDIIARSKWPKESGGTKFSMPVVFFVPDSIVLMGAVVVAGAELIVTVVAEPRLDQQGLLNLRVVKVKVGAMNITLLARVIAGRMYLERLAAKDIGAEDIRAQIAASLLDNEPFEPIFRIEDKKVRAGKITITQGKLTVRLIPVFD